MAPSLRARRAVLSAVTVLTAALALVAPSTVPSAQARTSAPRAMPSVFPAPGSHTASPQTQISLRGVAPAHVGTVTVTGSTTGAHTFTVAPHSDGQGASLLMTAPFAPGERVSVHTSLPLRGSTHGAFAFIVAIPAADLPTAGSLHADAEHAQYFASAPALTPPQVTISTNKTPASEGYLFLDSHIGSLQQGPEIVDAAGNLVWFHPIPAPEASTDFREQTYHGHLVLTWWEGGDNGGHGYGVDQIYGADYQPIATVHAGNGYQTDAHDFVLTSAGTALVTIYSAVQADLRPVGGPQHGTVLDGIMQEIDVKTGLVLFEWHSLDHVPLTDSYQQYVPGRPYDYFHINSLDKAPNGNYLISARVTSTVYDVDRTTGGIIWRLGGKRPTYKLKGQQLSFQHDAKWHADGSLTVFNNAYGAPAADWRSHVERIVLDSKHHTAKVTNDVTYPHGLLAPTQGDVEVLPDGNWFVGYGQRPQFAEYAKNGTLLMSGSLPASSGSYRTYRYPWVGTPAQPPSVVGTASGGSTVVKVSWNGATQVRSWQVLVGPSPSALAPVTTATRGGFETAVTVPGAPAYVEVRGLDAKGTLIGQSAATRTAAG